MSITSAEGGGGASAQESEMSDLELRSNSCVTACRENFWDPEPGPAPPLPPEMKLICTRDLNCSAEGFFQTFLAESVRTAVGLPKCWQVM